MFFLPVTNWSTLRRETFIIQFIFALALVILKNKIFSLYYIRVLLLWLIIGLSQALILRGLDIIDLTGQILFISYPFFLVVIFNNKMPFYYVKVLVFFTIISFFIYVPSFFSHEFHRFIYSFGKSLNLNVFHYWKTSFFFYTWEPMSSMGLLRNSGMFSEPGNYAAHLLLGLSFNIVRKSTFINKENIIMALGLISTFSTAGYLGFGFILLYYAFFIKKEKLKKGVLLFFLIPALGIVFLQAPFLNNKIKYFYTKEITNEQAIRGRFGVILQNLDTASKHLIIGRGVLSKNRFDIEESQRIVGENVASDLNSWTGYLVRLGLPGFLIFMYWYYSSIKLFLIKNRLSKNVLWLIFGSIVIGLSSQAILVTPPFFSILYLGYVIKVEKYN